jgi:4-carboxymuconolactone decarboxylase
MTRLAMPSDNELTAVQNIVIAEVVAGKRGKVPAPMIAWLRNPELARRAQHLGELLRFETTLAPALRELAILVCGRHWTSHHEWTAHKKIALEAGLDPRTIDDIAAGRGPFLSGPLENIVYQVSSTLLSKGKLSDALYHQGLEALGEQGMVELVGILGYYSMVALTLNAFEIGLPENFASELETKDNG